MDKVKETIQTNEDGKDRPQSEYYDKRPVLGNKGPSKLREQFSKGMTFFLVVAASIIFYFLLLRLTHISGVLVKIIHILKPVIYGFAFAYLLNPMVKGVEKWIKPVLEDRIKKESTLQKLSRGIGVAVSLFVAILLVIGLCNMVIPELYKSIRDLIVELPGQLNAWVDKLNQVELDNSTTGLLVKNIIEEGTAMFQEWLRTDLLKQTNSIMSSLTVGVVSIVSELLNAVIGIIISIYVLFSKEVFAGQCKKIIYAVLNPDRANLTLHLTKKSNEIFGGFIIGKIIDSLIIGVLCFLCLTILNMPYTLLVSVIVGVTNIIPFFGPYIGAIPSAILIMLADPMKGVYFILFILVLQQVDGNIIGPKILGDSTGLSAFWVVVAILLGGGLFGFVGMIMGVPTFAVIYYIFQMLINQKLEKKKLPTHSENYDQMSYVDESGKFVFSEDVIEIKKKMEAQKQQKEKGE